MNYFQHLNLKQDNFTLIDKNISQYCLDNFGIKLNYVPSIFLIDTTNKIIYAIDNVNSKDEDYLYSGIGFKRELEKLFDEYTIILCFICKQKTTKSLKMVKEILLEHNIHIL